MLYVAQTNLQLFNHMKACGYSLPEVERVAVAYELATHCFNGKYRGTGKPLLCHLVGIASILISSKMPVETAIAGLLHAVPGDADVGLSSPKDAVTSACGEDIYKRIRSYADLRYSYNASQVKEFLESAENLTSDKKEALIIRIANEIEDYADNAMNYYTLNGKKSYTWRIEYVTKTFPILASLAKKLDQEILATQVEELVQDINNLRESIQENVPPHSLLRKEGKMYFIKPKSMKYRSTFYIIKRIKKARRLLHKKMLGHNPAKLGQTN